MQVSDIMTARPMCCTPDTPLQQVAQMMVQHDCGCIPVIESQESRRLVGVITDRDICCRTVAVGRNPLELTADDVMTRHVVSVTENSTVEECCNVMEQQQIRRVAVVNAEGRCCGIVSQADIALRTAGQQTAEVVKEVSQPTDISSRAAGA